MKQNLFLFVFVLLLALAAFFIYLSNNFTSNNLVSTTTTKEEPPLANENLEVNVYFSNFNLSGDSQDCSLVYPVKRTINIDGDPFIQTLNLLFMGPTEQEKAQGYSSVFSLDTKNILKNIDIDEEGTVYIDLHDIRSIIPNASSSCGSAQFLNSVFQTLKQFQVVKKVIYAINGDPKIFYEWMQIGCSEENNNCDPTPFSKFYQEENL
ncbi:MAG: GerMN domain-containing protein [Candidatus Paceibacterota bacterium]